MGAFLLFLLAMEENAENWADELRKESVSVSFNILRVNHDAHADPGVAEA
jgi:hypothetical protein